MAKRRLRTGPTAALPAKPAKGELLRLVRLADPDAREDGEDVVAADVRVHAPVEAEPDLVGGMLEQVWAVRVSAEGPLPFDFFDRYLAEGLAFRLGGLAVCRGEVSDPADEEGGGPAVIVPVRPADDELLPRLEAELGEVEQEEEFVHSGDGVRVLVVPQKGRPPAVQELLPFASDLTAIELRGEDGERLGVLALRLAEALNGLVVDRWRFRVDAAADLLPPPGKGVEPGTA
ncbi:hypothetical protein [Nonomuraea sp. NPDC005501]|uniref:hypothetical protein n=1 Tax=Nonomuraea sp. NPDC005501 TaxID=3156884 RepID=UPI0033AA4128